jgi:membrane protease YdiL (CAAX protease family)
MGISLIKVGVFLLIWLLFWLPLVFPLAKYLQWQPFHPLSASQKLPLVASLYVLIPLVVWAVTTYEGGSWADYGLKLDSRLLMGLCWGLILGIAGLGLIFSLEWRLGWLTWHGENWHKLSSLGLPLLLLGLWIGWTEELVFRGVFINQLSQDFPIWAAATISSLIFALLHLIWERQDTLPQLPGLWLMGMVLVGARLATGGSLGLAWGLHAGWVWGLATLDAAELISYTGKGATWFTGLRGYPLAGVAGLLCLLMTGIILFGLSPL